MKKCQREISIERFPKNSGMTRNGWISGLRTRKKGGKGNRRGIVYRPILKQFSPISAGTLKHRVPKQK